MRVYSVYQIENRRNGIARKIAVRVIIKMEERRMKKARKKIMKKNIIEDDEKKDAENGY